MKPIVVLLFSVIAVSHTFGFHLQNPVHGSNCGCGGDVVNIPLDQIPVFDQQSSDDDSRRYKFDFGIQQPVNVDTEPQLSSHRYQIRAPCESNVDNTKYKYDYTLQQPVEEKVIEAPKRTLHTKVDRIVQDNSACTCAPGHPCTCGYSAPVPVNNNAYILPVRYNNGDDFVYYDAPQEESNRYLHRVTRQTSTADPSILDHIRTIAAAIREHRGQMKDQIRERFAPAAERVGSTLSALQANADQTPRQTLRERISSIAEPIVSMVKGSLAPARSKRDLSVPVLRVKEYNPLKDQTRFAKFMNKHVARVELPAPEQREIDIKVMEKASHCHSCGSKLNGPHCSHCGQYQPQYVEFIEGSQVPFYPGAVQTENQQSAESNQQQQPMTTGPAPRYVFDRLGHKYLENNGKLRLVRNQPDFAGLADILNQNRAVMSSLNQQQAGRLMPQPIDIVSDFTKMVRDLARQRRHNFQSKNQEKRTAASMMSASPRSMYQVMPMQYDDQDTKLVVKIYDKNAKDMTTDAKMNDDQQETEMTAADQDDQDDSANTMKKTSPSAQQFAKKDKKFEILTFDDFKGTSDDEIRRVLEYLHPKQLW